MTQRPAAEKHETIPPEAEITPIEQQSIALLHMTEQLKTDLDDFYPRLLDEDFTEDVNRNVDSLKRATTHISKALTQIYAMKDELSTRLQDVNKEKNNRFLHVPANTTIDEREQELHHFASGLNRYKLMLICFIGSFLGVVMETLWCLVKNGYIRSRAGLVYGPFNLLYGMGAVVLTLALYKYRNRGAWLSCLGGAIVGSAVEYICSWGQELFLGSRSWDYSGMPFNLNGRICLLYSLYWGVLGVLWIKVFYPVLTKWILKLPNRFGMVCTWIVTIFLLFNVAVSGLSLSRWAERNADLPADNAVEEFLDRHFPDERMEHVYANMVFSKP